jgi:hypothetical protein
MFDFIGYFLKAPGQFAKKLVTSPIGTIFYGLISKWYIISMSVSVVVLYWVIKGLSEAGILDSAYNTFIHASLEIKGFVQHCTPKIKDLNVFFQCLIDTPSYTGDSITNLFEEDMMNTMKEVENHPVNHEKIYLLSPYDQMNDDEVISQDPNRP